MVPRCCYYFKIPHRHTNDRRKSKSKLFRHRADGMSQVTYTRISVMVSLWLFVACSDNSQDEIILTTELSEQNDKEEPMERIEEVVIGATIPLSEPGSVGSGAAMLVAFTMAANEINAAGGILGKSLKVVVKDTAGLPEQGASTAEALITQKNAVGIVGEYHSAVALAISDVAHRHHVPVIFVDTYADAITASGYSEVFRIAPTSSFTAQMDARWLAEVGDYNGDGKIFAIVVAENTDYGIGQVGRAQQFFPEYGLGLTVIYAEIPAKDFSETITEIKALKRRPDAIFIKVTGEFSFYLQQQLYEAGFGSSSKTIVVANQLALNHETYWKHVPNGAFAVVPRVGPWTSTATKRGLAFADKYRETFGRWPEAYAFTAYDSLYLMADAIERASSLEADAVITALEQTNLELAAGHYTFPYGMKNPAGGYVPEYMWHQWPDVPLLFLQYTQINQHSDDTAVIWPKQYRTIDKPILRPE